MRIAMSGLMGLALCCGDATAQGPATKLSLTNATDKRVVFMTYRPSSIFLTAPFESGDRRTIDLALTKDDRVLVASPADTGPYKVFATTSFNASAQAYPTVGAALVGDGGGYRIVFYYMADGAPKALKDDEQRLIDKNKETIKKAEEKPKGESAGP